MADLRAFVFARMSSRRLPGKVLARVGNQTLLEIVCRKLASADFPIVVLTSGDAVDDVIEEWASAQGLECFRGPRDDVAARACSALRQFPCRAFYRVNADSPYLIPSLLAVAKKAFTQRADIPDLVSNLVRRTYPYGVAVELINSGTFLRVAGSFSDLEREHITSHFYHHAARFRLHSLELAEDLSSHRLVVDTSEDLAVLRRLLTQDPTILDQDLFTIVRQRESLQ